MGAIFDFRECEDCGRVGVIAWGGMPDSAYEECRVRQAYPCSICTEWNDDEERLALLLARAPGVKDQNTVKVIEETVARLLSGKA